MGMDYAFTENIFGMVEYHYNGAGSTNPADYRARFDTTPYQRGGVFLLGRDYLMPSLTTRLSPLWNLATQAIINLHDHSAFLAITAEYNLADDLYMDFGYYNFLGDDLGQATDNTTPEFQSEYGLNPDTAYLSLRYYF